jgi:alkylhydroperoxidase/carboxymuconolactone decarboxylase family protein YurZ
MEALVQLLTTADLDRLRSVYDKRVFLTANQDAFSSAYAPLGPWADAAGAILSADTPIAPQVRELCLITLLAYRAPGLSLATHVYWGLMEGATAEQVCHAVSFAGCYGGFPTLATGLVVVKRTLLLLKGLAVETTPCASDRVLAALAQEFASINL